MCSSDAKLTVILKFVLVALGSRNRASSAGTPAATIFSYSAPASANSAAISSARPARSTVRGTL